ncbi:hypothetical protein CMK19_18775 [Candidatus Poribacteria bacterium]|nr:hypothetical protein [Candidatus Poribacteria bacterium]MEE2909721.1 hypothetical protein [Candidatus Poribacteria bacterium]
MVKLPKSIQSWNLGIISNVEEQNSFHPYLFCYWKNTVNLGLKENGICGHPSRSAYWKGKNEISETASNGTYFYQLRAGDYTETRKLIILKWFNLPLK